MAGITERLLGFSASTQSRVLDDDTPCKNCGYNLRGLIDGQRCPECGNVDDAETRRTYKKHTLVDVLASGTQDERRQWKHGMALIVGAMIIWVCTRFATSLLMIFAPDERWLKMHVVFGAVAAISWLAGIRQVLPISLLNHWQWMRKPRQIALILSLAWIPGYALWYIEVFSNGSDALAMTGVAFRFLGCIGVLAMCVVERHVASEAELFDAEQKFNSALFFLPFFLPIGWILAGIFNESQGVSSVSEGLVMLLPLSFYVCWAWQMINVIRACLQMRGQAMWAIHRDEDAIPRQGRIKQKQAALNATAEAAVRYLDTNEPIPSGSAIDDDLNCHVCNYNLRGLHYGMQCPECGDRIAHSALN